MQSRISQRSTESSLILPKKQEWAIIYDHRARELEQAKSMEKLLSQQKKDNFKRQLDEQIHSKRSVGRAEKEEDRRYYERVLQQAQELKEKQEREKFEMYMKHKSLEEANIRLYEAAHDPKLKQSKRVYNIQFGLQSEQEKKERSDAIKKDVIQTVQKQLQQKQEEKKLKRQQEIELDARNVKYQIDLFNNRYQNQKKYEQNQGVYNYYKDLHAQRMRRDRDLEHKLVDEVHMKKQEEANRKKQLDALAKQKQYREIQDTLERQIQLIHKRKQQQSQSNPEQNNYSFFNSIFRQRKASVDKKQYNSYLQKQAQEQRLNKLQQHYMSEQQYRLNANQLNKAISGQYTYDRYFDRSVGTLGDKLNLQKVDPLQTEDAELVKTKLENLRTRRNRSMFEGRNELNQSLF